MSEKQEYKEKTVKPKINSEKSFFDKKYQEVRDLIKKMTGEKKNEIKTQVEENVVIYGNDILSNPRFKKLIENNNYFFKNHFKFNKEICEWLSFNNNLSVSVIERESSFDKNAKSPTGADSYMQLTGKPFEDMSLLSKGSRGHLYMKYFQNIPENKINSIQNEKIKISLNKLKILSQSKDLKKIKTDWNKQITILEVNRADPNLNLLIGNIYLHFLKNIETDGVDGEKRIDNEIKELKKLINIAKKEKINLKKNKKTKDGDHLTKIEKRFKMLLEEKGMNLKIGIPELENLYSKLSDKNNVDFRKNFYALSRYNGDSKKDSGVAHKTIYAAAVTKAMENKNTNKSIT